MSRSTSWIVGIAAAGLWAGSPPLLAVPDGSGTNHVRNIEVTENVVLSGVNTYLQTGEIRGQGSTLDINGRLIQKVQTLAADDTTPDISGGNIFITSGNTGATVITDLDNPKAGQVIMLVGGSNSNPSTIADSGNFNLSAAWTASLDDVLILLVVADNDYIELGRVDN